MSNSNGALVAAEPPADKLVVYKPFGENAEIKLGLTYVQQYLVTPTKNGHLPTAGDCINFMQMCKSRELNPFAGDAYLVGYEDRNGNPQFSLITAVQAFFKRSELCPEFDGIESGVIVRNRETKELEFHEGDFYLEDEEILLGGWSRCYRKDRSRPFYDALNLSVYSTGRSRWAKDPAGMIVKCAESSTLRQAFPTHLGGLYNQIEMEHVVGGEIVAPRQPGGKIGDSEISSVPDVMPEPDPGGDEDPEESFIEGTDAAPFENEDCEEAYEDESEENRGPSPEEAPDLYDK